MNALDLAILLAIALAAIGGYRLGFLTRGLSWAGLALATLLAVHFVPDLTRGLADATPRARLLGILGFVLGLALLGQALGLAVGAVLRTRLPLEGAGALTDRVAGAAVGGVGVLVFVWLLVPAFASAPGWPARAARRSAIVSTIERVVPPPPRSIRELGRMVGQFDYGQVFKRFTQAPSTGAPPVRGLPAAVGARVAASVVKVEGRACDQIQDGTGFVVAPQLVVTNAHVVAGERRTSVETQSGDRATGRVVTFDPRRDLALIRVPTISLAPLPVGDADAGTGGAVFGHPGGGPLAVSPARVAKRVTARGTDIYRTTETERDVFVLAARLAPGDSGGPFVDQRGRVAGVAFAIDPGADATAYALTTNELRPVVAAASPVPVDTGECLLG